MKLYMFPKEQERIKRLLSRRSEMELTNKSDCLVIFCNMENPHVTALNVFSILNFK